MWLSGLWGPLCPDYKIDNKPWLSKDVAAALHFLGTFVGTLMFSFQIGSSVTVFQQQNETYILKIGTFETNTFMSMCTFVDIIHLFKQRTNLVHRFVYRIWPGYMGSHSLNQSPKFILYVSEGLYPWKTALYLLVSQLPQYLFWFWIFRELCFFQYLHTAKFASVDFLQCALEGKTNKSWCTHAFGHLIPPLFIANLSFIDYSYILCFHWRILKGIYCSFISHFILTTALWGRSSWEGRTGSWSPTELQG